MLHTNAVEANNQSTMTIAHVEQAAQQDLVAGTNNQPTTTIARSLSVRPQNVHFGRSAI